MLPSINVFDNNHGRFTHARHNAPSQKLIINARTTIYWSECWTTCARQEKRLNMHHLQCLCRVLHFHWSGRIPNKEILRWSGSCSMQVSLLKQRLRWLGHVRRMDEGRIPKDILYGQFSEGKRGRGRPLLRYRDVIRFDLLAAGIDLATWETSAFDRPTWRRVVTDGARRFEARRHEEEDANRAKGKRRAEEKLDPGNAFACDRCGRQCRARIGLISQRRCCVPK